MIDRYSAAIVQSNVQTADETDPERAEQTVLENLASAMDLVDYLFLDRRYSEPDLVVFSEYCLTSVPESRTLEGYQNLATEIPGPVSEVVAETAIEHGTHIVMNALEYDPDWPDRVFNTSFIVDPDGEIVLKYRKLNGAQVGHACYSNPGDFLEQYVDFYGGPEALFPVAETEIGTLACMSCTDVRFAEVARCLALRGAEVLIHPTAEPSREAAFADSWEAAKRVRAWENQCYLLSADNGRILGGPRPEFRQRGRSKMFGPDGGVLARIDTPGENVAAGTVDLERLRQRRLEDTGYNVPVTSRYQTYLPIFEEYDCWPDDPYADDQPERDVEADVALEEARRNAIEKGVLRRHEPD